ncbi:von Willebrand factor type A domain protein, partial [Aerococcus viridans ATCC 11563 = CCUG 4311]
MNSLKGGVSLKKIYNKIISLFVLFTLLLGYGGSVVSHVSAESTGGLQDTIGVDKTAKRTPGCRTFEVNLNITGELQQAPVDVVLVLDRSGSMNFVETPNSPTRLDYGKLAAINFAERVLGPNGIPGSRVSVVSFSGPAYATGVRNNPQRHYGQQNQATTDLDLSSDLRAVTDSINRITAFGGTNTEAGFEQGRSVIEGTTSNQNPNSNKVVIMLTDGLPTASNGNPYAETTDINHVHIQRAINAGKNIYQNDIADVFTIGLTTGMNATEKALADNILTQAQNKGYYPAPSATDLDAIFEEISQRLGYASTNAKVVDKIGDNFDLVESSLPAGATYNSDTREITWNPGTIYESAQLKYTVVAKPDFPGGPADTNEFAKLTYKDIFGNDQTKDFPVPEVDVPTLIEVSLTDATINLGDSINLGSGTDENGENYMSPVTGGDNDGTTFTYEWRKVGDDTVISKDKNPSVSPTEDTQYELTVIDSNGCIAKATMWVRVSSLTVVEETRTEDVAFEIEYVA